MADDPSHGHGGDGNISGPTKDEAMDFDEGSTSSEDDASENGAEVVHKVYVPGDELVEGDQLVCDESAYVMYHRAQTGD